MKSSKDENIKKYACTECVYATSEKNNLKLHIEAVIRTLGTMSVESVDMLPRKTKLKKHIERVHEKIRTMCGECG